jgi:Flp pilus assembly protein TadB
MDVVRFGRALGFGARQAVKTVTAAVDAATSENPSHKSTSTGAYSGQANARPQARPAADSSASASGTAASKALHQAAHAAAQTVVQARGAKQGLKRGSRRFGGTAWKTFTRLWGVLWLEVVGVVFGLFVVFAATGAWHLREEWHANAAGHRQLVGALAMLALFGYFCVSSFVRARRRERRR